MLLFKHRFSLTPLRVVKLFTLVNIRSNRVKSPSEQKIGKVQHFPTDGDTVDAAGVEMSYDRSNDEHFMSTLLLCSCFVEEASKGRLPSENNDFVIFQIFRVPRPRFSHGMRKGSGARGVVKI